MLGHLGALSRCEPSNNATGKRDRRFIISGATGGAVSPYNKLSKPQIR